MITLLKNKLLQFFSQCFRYLYQFFEFFGKHPVIGGVCLFISLLFTFYAFVLDRRGEDSSTVSVNIIGKKIDKLNTAMGYVVEKIDARDIAEKLMKENGLLKETKRRRKLSKNQKEVVTQEITRAIDDLVINRGEIGSQGKVTGALEALKNSDITKVKRLLSDAIKHSKQNDQKTAQMYRNVGAFLYLDDLQGSLQAYRTAIKLAPDNVDGWMMQGVVLEGLGKLDESNIALQKVLNLITNNPNEKNPVREVPIKSIDFYKEGLTSQYGELDLLDLLEVYTRSSSLSSSFSSSFIDSDYGKELDLANIRRYREGYKYYEELLKDFNNLKELDLVDTTIIREDVDKHYKKMLKILNYRELRSDIYRNLGNIYRIQGDLIKATGFYNKSVEIDKDLIDKNRLVNSYGNVGLLYKNKGELDKSIEFFEKSLLISKELKLNRAICSNYINLGVVYQTLRKLDTADDFYKKANATLISSTNTRAKEWQAYIIDANRGALSMLKDNQEEAQRFWLKSLRGFKKLDKESPTVQRVQFWLDSLSIDPPKAIEFK